ncbi:MAG: 3-oxoacyl-ACP synthase [Deltaproteobacteria bacterium]|nr:MAG: 3-oxoacyl-ACP synthase [Deltaproteobacteria bacterium]
MKDAATGKKSKAKPSTDWDRLRNMSDAAVHAAVEADPDAHPTDEAFWEDAKVVMPQRKEVITIRLDADLLAWFRQQPGYQTRINAILRTYMKAHANKEDQHAPA